MLALGLYLTTGLEKLLGVSACDDRGVCSFGVPDTKLAHTSVAFFQTILGWGRGAVRVTDPTAVFCPSRQETPLITSRSE